MHRIKLVVNGKEYDVEVDPSELLLNVIRERLGFTGIKCGRGIGECGAFTVLLNDRPVFACLILAMTAKGKEITTIEDLQDATTKKIRESFLNHRAVQCGFCTPGVITMVRCLLEENQNPTECEIKEYLRENICRCTGYRSISEAVRACGEKSAQVADGP